MKRFTRSAAASALAAATLGMAGAGPAFSHPHIFAEAILEVAMEKDGTVEALRHVWRFDDLFSSTVLLQFDQNADLVLDNDELAGVGGVIHESLAEFDYFQVVSVDGKAVQMQAPDRIMASFENDQLLVFFESRPAETLKLGTVTGFGVYDPTFYTAIDFYDDDSVTVTNLPEGCTSAIVRPDPDEAIAMNQQSLTDAFFEDPDGVDTSKLFATRLELDCSAGESVAVVAQAPTQPRTQSPLGIGAAPETTLPSTGLFAGVTNWINAHQREFYRTLTGALRSIRDGAGGMWIMIGLSFAYGVFHAAGPGHGKAVISSYMLANEVALRRGVLLSFVSSILQAITAIVVMGVVFVVLRGTSISTANATRFLEIASYALVTGFGAWLLWRKAWPHIRRLAGGSPAHSLSAAHAHAHHDHHHGHHHHHGHDDHHHHLHDHGPGEVCSTCGHSHAPDPTLISGERFDWRTAWAAIMAVGLRPCTGALVVLSFAFLNGLWAVGVLSVFAMALGTAITVSALAIMAVTAKNWAVAFAGDGRMGNRVHAAIEITGAAFVFLLGLLLLTAALSA